MRPGLPLLTAFLSATLLSACSLVSSIPVDAEGTYDRARDGTLVVGVSEHPPWTNVDDDTGEVTGIEADLIEGFAESINAEVEWRTAAESVLAEQIKSGELDVVVGGLTTSAPGPPTWL